MGCLDMAIKKICFNRHSITVTGEGNLLYDHTQIARLYWQRLKRRVVSPI